MVKAFGCSMLSGVGLLNVMLSLLLAACGSPISVSTVDSGQPDAGVSPGLPRAETEPDAGLPDAGQVDAGFQDAPDVDTVIQRQLSDYGLFERPLSGDAGLIPAGRNVPYQLTTSLFSDHALKDRSIFVPQGKRIVWKPDGLLNFPVGTIITKTFSFVPDFRKPFENRRRYETRLLVRQRDGWEAWPYVWDESQREAVLAPGGRFFEIRFLDQRGRPQVSTYAVPSRNQCQTCHHVKNEAGQEVLTPIGPKSRWLSRSGQFEGRLMNQLRFFENQGLLVGLPQRDPPATVDAFDPEAGSVSERARAYLDINCGHCHNPKATAGQTSQLFLDLDNVSLFNLGVCKRPGSAGGGAGGIFDIVPGSHQTSILWFRLQTEESGKLMPQIGRSLRDERGSALIADWIDSLGPQTCQAP